MLLRSALTVILMSIEKKSSRRKAAPAEPVLAPEVEVLAPVARKKAPAKKTVAVKEAAPKVAAKKVAAKKVAAKKVSASKTVDETVEVAEVIKPARKAAPRKNKARAEALPAPAPAPLPTALLLQRGLEAHLRWQAGDDCPPELAEFAASRLDAQGCIVAETAHDFVAALVEQARALGHALQIEPAVWSQLAFRRDAEGRVRRLEQLLNQGCAAPVGCPAYQFEAALFAVSAGRALLADDVGLGQREAAQAALRLWHEGFGLERMAVLAPSDRHAAWRGALPEDVSLHADPATLREQALDALVVDVIEAWDVDALRRLNSTHLLLLAQAEPLRDERLGAWIDWLDEARRGPVARLSALPAEAGPRERREALQTLLLSRRKRELVDRLPATLEVRRDLPVRASLPSTARARLQAASERWQRLGYATEAERAEVLQALQELRETEFDETLLRAQAEALRQLADEWAPLPLRVAAEPAKRSALAPLLADRPELLATDECAAMAHLDLPWSNQALQQRYAAHAGQRGLPVAWLLPEGGLSAALKRTPLPQCMDEAPPWWPDAEWAALMDRLPILLDW